MYLKNLKRFKNIYENIFELNKQYIGKPELKELAHPHTEHSISQWEIPYPSNFSLLNLNYINKIKTIDSAPFYFVRDGIFLTNDFFNRCIKDIDLRSLFLFHQGMRDYIPDDWSENVLFFEYEYSPKASPLHFTKKSSRNLILKFNLLNKCFDLEKILSAIDRLENYHEIILCFSIHETNYFLMYKWDGGSFLHSSYESLNQIKSQCLKKCEKVTSLPLADIHSMKDLVEYDYYDVSFSEHYYVDDFTKHHCMLSGAKPIFLNKLTAHSDDLQIPLSFHHGLRILSSPERKNNDIQDIIKKTLPELGVRKGDKLNTSAFQFLHSLTEDHTHFSSPKQFIKAE